MIKSQRGISGTCNLHGEMITLYNSGWCRSNSAVLSQVVIGIFPVGSLGCDLVSLDVLFPLFE